VTLKKEFAIHLQRIDDDLTDLAEHLEDMICDLGPARPAKAFQNDRDPDEDRRYRISLHLHVMKEQKGFLDYRLDAIRTIMDEEDEEDEG